MNTTQDEMRDTPLWRVLGYAAQCFGSSWLVAATYTAPWSSHTQRKDGRGYIEAPWWHWMVCALTVAPAMGFVQGYGCLSAYRQWLPEWPIVAADTVMQWWSDRLDKYEVHYSWLPADSGDPEEIGMHARYDTLSWVRGEDGRRVWTKRPRMFVRASPTVSFAPWVYSTGEPTATATTTAGGYTVCTEIRWEAP